MTRKCKWLTVVMIMAPLLFLHAQSIRITATLDSTNYRVGDWIRIQLSAEHPFETKMRWNRPVVIDAPGFEKLAESAIDSIEHNDFLTERKMITVTTFDTGVRQIPPITCYYEQKGVIDSALSNPLSVYIAAVAIDTAAAARPLKGIFTIAATGQSIAWYLLPFLLLILIALAAWNYFHQKTKLNKHQSQPEADTRLPHEKAYDLLMSLELEKPWEHDLVKEYYVQVTQILREYIETGLELPALENTTQELLVSLRKKSLDEKLILQLSDDLNLADLVKFAKVQPATASHLRILHTVKDFIQKTTPVTHLPAPEGQAE